MSTEDDKTIDRGDEIATEGEESEDTGAVTDEPSADASDDDAVDSGDAADSDASDDDGAEPLIPKWRFDEAQRKARERYEELERKLGTLEKQQATETKESDIEALSGSIDTLQDQYEDHLLEGNLEKARLVRKQLTQKQNELTEMRLAQQSQQTGRAAVEQVRFDTQLAHIEARYPALNPDSADFNKDLATEVAEILAAFQARGFTASAALQKAVHYVLRPDQSEGKDADILRSQRGHQARKKAADTVRRSPPDISKAGRDSDKGGKGDGLPDIGKMSPEQFDKLSEEDRAKLRGDFLEEEA